MRLWCANPEVFGHGSSPCYQWRCKCRSQKSGSQLASMLTARHLLTIILANWKCNNERSGTHTGHLHPAI